MRRSNKVAADLNEMAGEAPIIEVTMTSTAKVVSGLRRTKNNLNLADLYPNSQPEEQSVVIIKTSHIIMRANPKPRQESIGFTPPATLIPSDDEDEIITPPSALAEKMRSSALQPATPAVKTEAEDTVIIREQVGHAPVKSKTKETSILEATLKQNEKNRAMLHAIKAKITKDPEACFSHSGPIAIPARPKPAESDEKCFLASRSDSPTWRTNVYDSHVPHTANFRK